MNERIKQLAREADIYINKSNCVESGNGTEIIGWHIEKFAELIVRACADIAKDTQDFYDEHNDSQVNTEIWTMIKLHFGVEE